MKFNISEKIKNMSMRTKRIAALVICLLLLTVAVFQNMDMDEAEAGNKNGNGDVNVSLGGNNNSSNVGNLPGEEDEKGVMNVADVEEYFAAMRLNRLNERSKTEENCNEIIDSENSEESAVADAVAQIETLKQIEKMETGIETSVKARGYNEVFAIIENDNVYITIETSSIDSSEASAIAVSACDITGYSIDDVVVKGVC